MCCNLFRSMGKSNNNESIRDSGSFNSCCLSVIKSPSDKRDYRALVLENSLKVLLISDLECDKAAASMSVAVGSMSDPKNLQGLAHLCEHMLFADGDGDSKNSYSKFISENGGSCNAFTTRDQTNYHFDVSTNAFQEALKRFSSFFANRTPRFLADTISKEINVIQSEFENKLFNDFWRRSAIQAYSDTNGHPYYQFSTGNKESLEDTPKRIGLNVRQSLKDFHKMYYSSNIMSLVVLGKESLDELEEIVKKLFSGILNLQIKIPVWTTHPFGLNEFKRRIDIVPAADIRDLFITFPIPDTRQYFKCFSHGYFSYLLGHKGPGSLCSFLKRRNLVNNIYVSSTVPARGFGLFSIGFQLTVKGVESTDAIVGYTFQYLQLLRKSGPQEYFWKEMKEILGLHFQFQEKQPTLEYVWRIANVMHVYPLENVLSEGYILYEFNPSSMNELLGYFVPGKCCVFTIHKENAIKANLTEKWFGGKYSVSKISDKLIQAWESNPANPELKLPETNQFIPVNLHLESRDCKENTLVPKIILDTPLTRAWFLQDNEFLVPRGVVKVEIFSKLPTESPLNFNLNHILGAAIKDVLMEQFYAANLTGLYYSIKATTYGMEISVDGFSDKLILLLKQILIAITTFSFSASSAVEPQRFNSLKELYMKGLTNWSNQPPNLQINYYLTLLLREKRFSNEELLSDLNEVTPERLITYWHSFLHSLKIEWFVYGNFSKSESSDFIRDIEALFKNSGTQALNPEENIRLHEIHFPPGSNFLLRSTHTKFSNSCTAILFQLGLQNFRNSVLAELIEQMIVEPCFNQLRNSEQLGYIVKTLLRRSNGTLGLLILLQGTRDPSFVESRIDSFLENFGNSLKNMSETQFIQHKIGLAERKQEKPKNMLSCCDKIWNNEIYRRQYNFERLKLELEELQNVTQEEILEYYQKCIIGPGTRKRCCLHIGKFSDETDEMSLCLNENQNHILINDIKAWKEKMTFYSNEYKNMPTYD